MWRMNAKSSPIQWGLKSRLNEVKPPADVSDFLRVIYRASSIKIADANSTGEFDISSYYTNEKE